MVCFCHGDNLERIYQFLIELMEKRTMYLFWWNVVNRTENKCNAPICNSTIYSLLYSQGRFIWWFFLKENFTSRHVLLINKKLRLWSSAIYSPKTINKKTSLFPRNKLLLSSNRFSSPQSYFVSKCVHIYTVWLTPVPFVAMNGQIGNKYSIIFIDGLVYC